jgi:hypothetical protein
MPAGTPVHFKGIDMITVDVASGKITTVTTSEDDLFLFEQAGYEGTGVGLVCS